MKKNKGFMLAETLAVTIFVAGVLIFLFIQFSNLNNSYSEYYKYNTTESLYALEDVMYYIKSDNRATSFISSNTNQTNYIDITDCNIFTSKSYCEDLFELEGISKIAVLVNSIPSDMSQIEDEDMLKLIEKINFEGEEQYRLVAKFNNGVYSTLRFDFN